MTCTTCGAERPLANLTDGRCPECGYRAYQYADAHRVPNVPTVATIPARQET